MSISLIVAIANNNAMGRDNKLLAYLPKDLQWFKKNTLNKTVVMGRKTYDSLPNGALPKRKNIVLSRNKHFSAANCNVVGSYDGVLKELAHSDETFIIGGSEIYKLFLPIVDKMYITRIYADFEADTFFPIISVDDWQMLEKIPNEKDEKHKYLFDFLIYERIKGSNRQQLTTTHNNYN